MMSARQRILTALDGGTPDRVPCALAFYHVELERLAPPGAYRDDLVDVHFVQAPLSQEEQALAERVANLPFDTRLGTPGQILTYRRWDYHPEDLDQRNPLAGARTLDDLRAYPFPDGSSPCGLEQLSEQVAAWHAQGLAVGGNLPHLGGELFESAWRLRGLEAFLLDLVKRPDWADCLLDRLTALAKRNAQDLAAAGVDLLALDDDVGMPGTMFISPSLWRRFFKPRMAEIIDAARAVKPDLRVLYHSDGTIDPILGDLMEIGVNALNPLQPEHMDAQRVRRSCGPGLALWGTVGCQTTFSFGGPEEIRQEVRFRIETLGRAGLVLCPAYDVDEPDIPWENIAAFLEAVQRYG
ncbi:MAG: uroporphyrinogen decarboxylase family protein [Planctomycetota bacterium]|jgi:uroporphyrinogen decarboxylase